MCGTAFVNALIFVATARAPARETLVRVSALDIAHFLPGSGSSRRLTKYPLEGDNNVQTCAQQAETREGRFPEGITLVCVGSAQLPRYSHFGGGRTANKNGACSVWGIGQSRLQ